MNSNMRRVREAYEGYKVYDMSSCVGEGVVR